MTKDIHSKPFNEGTLIKLELLKLYFKSWIPVFIESKEKTIEIHDFFAGEGTDTDGNLGSPLIILKELKPYCSKLIMNKTSLKVQFNDAKKKKIALLESNTIGSLKICTGEKKYGFCKISNDKVNCPFGIEFNSLDFSEIFTSKYAEFIKAPKIPRFIFLDQYGIKHINPEVFSKLAQLEKTDFMFFISSSHIMRFKEMPEFKKYIQNIEFTDKKPSECHRVIYEYYKTLLGRKDYFLGQFSIKKNSNYYGIIFGSNHHLGMKKFLDAAWKIDPHTGETNHDIDSDPIRSGQTSLDLFATGNQDKPKKLAAFQEELMNFLSVPRSNKIIYRFALEKGISITKTNEVLKSLEKDVMLTFSGADRRKNAYYLDFHPLKEILIQTKWPQQK